MGIDKENNEPRMHLYLLHLAEWNAHLALEVQVRITLDEKHKEERKKAYSNEIGSRDGAILAAIQLSVIHELIKQNRVTRIAMRKRHTQESEELNQKLA
jgi:hypothetical protein